MPTYVYKARDGVGKSVKGTMEAPTQEELVARLHKMGYVTTGMAEALPGVSFKPLTVSFQRIKTEDLALFNIQLSNLIHAGVSLVASLETLEKQVENRKLKSVLESVTRAVESGKSFSEALAHHPGVFPGLFVNMIKAGEASGKLDMILSRYAVFMEEQTELKQKISGALFYPCILLLAGLGVTLFIVTFIIPQFVEIFIRSGIQLPTLTLALYQVGMGIKHFWPSLFLFLIAGIFGIRLYIGTPGGRLNFDRLALGLPLIGSLVRKASISRFARTLGMLVESGVPILQSLELVRDIIGNEVLARVVESARLAVEKGEKISEPLRVSGEFPPDTVRMVAVGEETGNLDGMLAKTADFYDRSVAYAIKKLTTLIEPLLLVVMGCMVGFMMASLLLPMFDMMKLLRLGRPGF